MIGIGDLNEIDPKARKNMPIGVCIAIAISSEVIDGISSRPTIDYYNTYHNINEKLDILVTKGAEYLKTCGYEAQAQTIAAVTENETEYNTVLPHKTIATRSGIGWIGKCALLVTQDYGSAVRISTILTNAPLITDIPINKSYCNNCKACTEICPAKAVKGINWDVSTPRKNIFDPIKCRLTARSIAKESIDKEITLCGKCIYICPYTQKYILREKKTNK